MVMGFNLKVLVTIVILVEAWKRNLETHILSGIKTAKARERKTKSKSKELTGKIN